MATKFKKGDVVLVVKYDKNSWRKDCTNYVGKIGIIKEIGGLYTGWPIYLTFPNEKYKTEAFYSNELAEASPAAKALYERL